MEFKQLEMFVALVEEGSMQRAAERVSRTQPAVSIAIRKLEEELGSRLFDRSERTCSVLTRAGALLYEHARRLLEDRLAALTALECERTLALDRGAEGSSVHPPTLV